VIQLPIASQSTSPTRQQNYYIFFKGFNVVEITHELAKHLASSQCNCAVYTFVHSQSRLQSHVEGKRTFSKENCKNRRLQNADLC